MGLSERKESEMFFCVSLLEPCVCLARGPEVVQRKEKEGSQQVFGAIGI